MAQVQQVSPQQRQAFFNQLTRNYQQIIPQQTLGENDTKSFDIPKSRLLSRIRLLVSATVKVTHATLTTYTPHALAPFTMFRNITLDLNNGFSPISLDGKSLALYNYMKADSSILSSKTTGRGRVIQPLTASAAGSVQTIKFMVDLPVTLNDRDAIGLVLLQNPETNVSLTISTDKGDKLLVGGAAGFTTLLQAVTVTPLVESYTVPLDKNAQPDLSILKIVNSMTQSMVATGDQTIKLSVGNTYRKIALFIEDASGNPINDTDLQNTINLIFNQAETTVRILPDHLVMINNEQYSAPLPNGCYVLDFSAGQGLANYSNARDYIDTERLTEFWLQITSGVLGKVTVLTEEIAHLK